MTNAKDCYFEVKSKLGVIINVKKSRWNKIITIKHLDMVGKEEYVKETLTDPQEIRVSKRDDSVYLYYKNFGKLFISVIAKHNNGQGFIITTYYTDRIKEGKIVWTK